ncbi:MAG: polymer-forming cytoskeletal protein [Anaerolineae bacterium]|nr:polymer-forming cytoskeletal protein [Anaerolineae bacterium]
MKRLTVVFILALALVMVAGLPVFAQGGAQIIVGRDVTIAPAAPVTSDLLVLGGNVDILFGGVVEGNLTVFGGSVTCAGTVRGDIVALGGDVTLRSGAIVEGDVAAPGGTVTSEALATVRGQVRSGWGAFGGFDLPVLPSVGRPWEWQWERGWTWDTLGGFFGKMLSVLVAVLAIVLFPDRVRKVRQTVLAAPWASLGVGILALVAAGVISLVLIITICLAVFGALVWVAVWALGMLGLAALGMEVGERILRGFGARAFAPAVAVLVGAFVLLLLTYLPCCVGALIYLAIASLAVGAAILSRLGAEPYLPQPAAPAA